MLLMFAPMRSVLAEQQSHCDMDEMPVSVSMSKAEHVISSITVSSHDSFTHDSPTNDASITDITAEHDCCCCDANSCVSNCDMSISASILMQNSAYTPIIISTSNSALFSSALLIRALPPLSRPPVILS